MLKLTTKTLNNLKTINFSFTVSDNLLSYSTICSVVSCSTSKVFIMMKFGVENNKKIRNGLYDRINLGDKSYQRKLKGLLKRVNYNAFKNISICLKRLKELQCNWLKIFDSKGVVCPKQKYIDKPVRPLISIFKSDNSDEENFCDKIYDDLRCDYRK